MSERQIDAEVIAMKIKEYIVDRMQSKELHLLKDKPKDGKGGIIHKLIARVESLDLSNNEKIEYIKKQKKPKEQLDMDFQKEKYEKLIALFSVPPHEIIDEYHNAMKKISNEHDIFLWLDQAAKRAGGRKYATHIAKLTHSNISTSASSFYDKDFNIAPKYLTTSSIAKKDIDITGNAGVSHYVSLLDIEHNGNSLRDYVLADDTSPFDYISNNMEISKKWIMGFKQVFSPNKPCTHSLAKQVFFPICAKSYHYNLLVPLVSSSLAHNFHRLKKKIREIAITDKYTNNIVARLPNNAVIKVTASRDAHRNVSKLHVDRNGELNLFSTRPPIWQSKIKPPIYKKSLFSDIHNSTIATEIDYLRDFLIRFKKLDISIKKPKRKQHIDRWVNNIIDECLFYVGTIQNLPSGWSKNDQIKLKKSHQYLLDPYRLDEDFQSERHNRDWQSSICIDFAQWLNYRLRDKEFTPQAEHTRLWKRMLEQPLREYMEPVEEKIKQMMKEAV